MRRQTARRCIPGGEGLDLAQQVRHLRFAQSGASAFDTTPVAA